MPRSAGEHGVMKEVVSRKALWRMSFLAWCYGGCRFSHGQMSSPEPHFQARIGMSIGRADLLRTQDMLQIECKIT